MTVTINLHNEEQEKALIEFLNKMQYDYLSESDGGFVLSADQRKEILKRDEDFLSGKTTARDWNDIKRDLKSVYR